MNYHLLMLWLTLTPKQDGWVCTTSEANMQYSSKTSQTIITAVFQHVIYQFCSVAITIYNLFEVTVAESQETLLLLPQDIGEYN